MEEQKHTEIPSNPSLYKSSYLSEKNILIDSFHIVSAHARNTLVPRYLCEITREGAIFIQLPYITQWNMEND